MGDKKYHNANITINIEGDKEAMNIYKKIKDILYDSDLKYFDHEVSLEHSSSFGFRNNLNEQDG